MYRLITALTVATLALFAIGGCSSLDKQPPLQQSAQYYPFIQDSFNDYLVETQRWLTSNRAFISDQPAQELAMNMPFEQSPTQPTNKAILLVHGLGDSPYSFVDLAQSYVNQGFYVQTLLLPGHGSNPEHLNLARYQDWQQLVDHYAELLKSQYDEVWLGGFSTGANLVTIHAIEQGEIAGLMLFSPGFQSRTPWLEKLAPIAALFSDGYQTTESNLARYSSAPLQGAISYADSAKRLRQLLDDNNVQIPTLIAISEADSIIDPDAVANLFANHFVHADSQLIWYGDSPQAREGVTSLSMVLPQLKISTGSHMSTIFAPSNPYYGIDGQKRICENSFDADAEQQCRAGAEVWFSAWGYEEEGKIHARLTWNPYYAELEQQIAAVAGANVSQQQFIDQLSMLK